MVNLLFVCLLACLFICLLGHRHHHQCPCYCRYHVCIGLQLLKLIIHLYIIWDRPSLSHSKTFTIRDHIWMGHIAIFFPINLLLFFLFCFQVFNSRPFKSHQPYESLIIHWFCCCFYSSDGWTNGLIILLHHIENNNYQQHHFADWRDCLFFF